MFKSTSEITLTPLSLPSDWGNIWKNFVEIMGRQNDDYLKSFMNSVIITNLSVLSIGILSAMAA